MKRVTGLELIYYEAHYELRRINSLGFKFIAFGKFFTSTNLAVMNFNV